MNAPASALVPDDFDQTFVLIGRLACQDRYRVAREVIDAWLRQRGKKRLIDERAAHVKERIREECEKKRLNRKDIGSILRAAFPVEIELAAVDPLVAEQAAQFMRMSRNGGWPVSKSPCGMWRVGTSLKTPTELVEIAKRKGFEANLTGDTGR